MILQRLIMTDFRQFEKQSSIDFAKVGEKHVSIVFASNGVGKTTILTALVWCLYGGKNLPFGDLQEQFLNNNTFHSLGEGDEVTVEVSLVFEDRNKKYVVTRNVVVQKEGNKQINKSFSLEVTIDKQLQHYAQDRINSILGPSMKEYFFFDGEGVGKFADSSKPDLVQKGIKNVMRIDTRQTALELIKEAKKTFDKESTKVQKEKGISNTLESHIGQLEEKLIDKNSKLEEARNARDIFEKKIEKIDKELLSIKDIRKDAEQKQRLQKELESIKESIKVHLQEQKELVTKKAYLSLSHEALNNVSAIINDKQQKGELPLIGIGKHFIEELIKDKHCICGEELVEGSSHYMHLESIMKRATAKTELEGNLTALGNFVEAHKNDNKEFMTILQRHRRQANELQSKKSELEQNIEAILNEIEEDLAGRAENLASTHKETTIEKDEKIKLIGSLETEIKNIDDELTKANKDLAVAQSVSEEVNLIRSRIVFCDNAIEMLKSKNEEEIESIREELSKRLEQRFDSMLHSEKKAYLDKDFRLMVIGKDGNASGKSRGEAKLISLIFISTLIELANEKEINQDVDDLSTGAGIYPIVVDSPYGEFDAVYKKTISKALKELSPQVIILLNQEQWNTDIEEVFKGSLAHAYRLVAHRPKLNTLNGDKNHLKFCQQSFELEVQDEKEFTTIERLDLT